jgi:CRISPR-associated RAMP protein (TIGR02581 family)
MNDLTTFRRRLRLKGQLVLETPLRLGSGQSGELSGADIAVVKDELGRPYIPGSSFKGALRAHIERLVRVAVPGRQGACNPVIDDLRCVPPRKTTDSDTGREILGMQELRQQAEDQAKKAKKQARERGEKCTIHADQLLYNAVWNQSCLICRLFGSPWLAGKVQVRDLTLVDPEHWLERRYQVRHGIGIDRDSETVASGLLFSYEAVPAGMAFEWKIVVENPGIYEYDVPNEGRKQVHEEGMLMLALREAQNGHVRLGGARSRGLGWIKELTLAEAELVDADDPVAFAAYLATGRPTHTLDEEAQMALAADFGRYLGHLASTTGEEV